MRFSTLPLLVSFTALSALGVAACGGDNQGTSTSGGSTTAQGGGGTGGTTSTGGTSAGGTTSTTTGTAGAGGTTTTGTAGSGGSGGMAGAGGATTSSTTTGTGGAVTGFDCAAPQGAIPALKRTPVIMGLGRPVFVTAAPGDDERLFVVEQTGQIRIFKGGVLADKPFLDIGDRVHQPGGGDERGLLGLAFHPDYATNGRFFVYYTDKNKQNGSTGDQNVVEFLRDTADAAKADAGGFGIATQTLFVQPDTESNHNGGMLAFGPDKMLYIGLGDGGGAGDQHGSFGNGQNLATKWGKILRVDVSTMPYSIPAGNITAVPPGNPTVGTLVPEIWDYGLRNPWRFSFDACTGDLYIGDVGQGNWEEVDVEPKGMGNRNYGWRLTEGNHPYNPGNFDVSGITPAVDEYPHTDAGKNIGCSISGGVVYRASTIPGLRGTYFYGDYCSGKIWTFAWDGKGITGKVDRTAELGQGGNVVSFGQDNQGNVYVIDLAGGVYRIDPQ